MAYLYSLNDLAAPAASPVCYGKITAGDGCATGEKRWHIYIR